MTRILFVSYTPDWSGPSNSLLKLIRHLPATYEASVLLPGQGAYADFLRGEGIDVFAVEHLCAGAVPEIVRIIRREAIDLVYGNTAHGAVRNAIIAAKLAGRPAVWHFREMVGSHPWRTKVCYLLADAVIAVSHACAAEVPRIVPRRRIHVVHNGIDCADVMEDRAAARARLCAELALPSDSRVILNAATVCERKGQTYAVEALRDVMADAPDAHLVLAGRLEADHGAYVDAVRETVRRYGLADHVHMPGFREDVMALMRGADLYIHTALKDPHPRAVMEAMVNELPVVAFAVDGVTETVVDGETGCLVPARDAQGMAAAMRRLLSDPALLSGMGEAAGQHVRRHFTAQSTADKVARVLEEVLERG